MTSGVAVEKARSARTRFAAFSNVLSERQTAVATYLLALLLGIAVTAYILPSRTILAHDIRVRPVYGYDAAMNVYGQRYFTQDAWRWPPLLIKTMGIPEGTNVGFTDGIPLAELVVKLFRGFLPRDFHSVYVWLALCWILQPIAAVFALRSAGERRLLPNLAVAIIAVSMPTLLIRYVHAALCSHFLILIALGLYFQITDRPKLKTIIGAGVLMLVSLLVNPYIMEMVIAVLVAAPVSLLFRRDRAWPVVAAGIAGGVIITAAMAIVLGFGHAVPMGGFATFSMNLLSPIYPSRAFFEPYLDATGGQYEGYQYLGAGVILMLLVADFCLSMQERLSLLRRHAGLIFSCVVLTCLALSTKVYAGNRLLIDIAPPSWLLQLRSSGRLFWPVAYTAIIAGAVIVGRKLSVRWATVALLVFASLQYLESMPIRREVRKAIRYRRGYALDTTEFRSLLASHSNLTVWPIFGCEGNVFAPEFSDLYLLASEVAIPVNATYVGRFAHEPNCNLPEFPVSVEKNELWVFVPQWTSGMITSVIDWQDICRQAGALVVCAQDLRGNSKLPEVKLPTVPLGMTLSTAINKPGSEWLVSGWYGGEPWGVFSHGTKSYLALNVDRPIHDNLLLTVWANSVGLPSATQRVKVLANGQPIGTWDIKQGAATEYSATIQSALIPPGTIFVEFEVDHPVNPGREKLAADPRDLGFGLSALRLDARKAE